MTIDLETIQHIHFVGVGGIGMSALARYFLAMKKRVSGSDTTESILTKEIENEGARIHIGHHERHVDDSIDLLIYTNAVSSDNPEIKQAKKWNIPICSYAQGLGLLTRKKYTIAIAGTHGKSTTTAMISLMLVRAGLDPTVIVGTRIKEFGDSNFRFGNSNFLVIEACEYKRAFLEHYPHIVVLPNIDVDHLDYFKDEKDYVSAFKSFLKKIPHGGYLVCNGDDKHIASLTKTVSGDIIDIHYHPTSFAIASHIYPYPVLQVPGQHNKINASLAFMVGKILNIPEQIINESLHAFTGTWRRFESKGVIRTGTLFFDDYGHHPTEIQATLKGARELYPDKNIICVFQPHQYSRTHHFLHEFGKAFKDADEVIIPDIYEVRDTKEDKEKIDTEELIREISRHHKHVTNGNGLKSTAAYLLTHTTKNDIVITMGAGNIPMIYLYLGL